MRNTRSKIVLLLVAASACTQGDAPVDLTGPSFHVTEAQPAGSVVGDAEYIIPLSGGEVVPAFITVDGRQTDGEIAEGTFVAKALFRGEQIIFHGEFTCLAIDGDAGRAWIGGVITSNQSEAQPWATGEIYEPGKDIWFRSLDSGDENRTTFVGFEGGAGIITSQEYCDTRPWPDDNARTNALTVGGISIVP